MTKSFTNINLETLILVAVWQQPFIFQGCFKLQNKLTNTKQFLYYRCECDKEKRELLENDFYPDSYRFTHLYRGSELIPTDIDNEAVLYLLKYALDTTLLKMISDQKHERTVIDEVALETMVSRIEPILLQGSWVTEDNEIGFAVSMDFNPSEEQGQAAVLTLLGKTILGKNEEGYLLH